MLGFSDLIENTDIGVDISYTLQFILLVININH